MSYKEVCHKVAQESNYGGLTRRDNFGLISCIVKSGDDLKQEQFAAQMITKFKDIFDLHGLKLWLQPFNIIATCSDGGLLQTIPDTISIDKLKKSMPQFTTLKQYFKATFRFNSDTSNAPDRTLGKKVMKRTIEQL